jgi:hypothetical protein
MDELKEAKESLYLLLVKMDTHSMTQNEIELMYLLANDEQVTEF